jgi:hypothetical protein
MFSTNKKRAISIAKEITTKHIDVSHQEEDQRKKIHIYNNRRTTLGRKNQAIFLFTDQLGRAHYKHIIHSW